MFYKDQYQEQEQDGDKPGSAARFKGSKKLEFGCRQRSPESVLFLQISISRARARARWGQTW